MTSCDLLLTSCELRFGPLVTRLCGGLYTLSMFLYMGIVVYMPALALEQVRSLPILGR